MRKSTITLGVFAIAALCLLMASFQSSAVGQGRNGPPAPNDECADCIEAQPLFQFRARYNTEMATTADDDPCISCCFFGVGQNSNSIWYCVDAPSGYIVRANTFGSDYDTVLAIWDTDDTGCPTGVFTATPSFACDNGPDVTEVACNDDAGGTLQSEASAVSDGDRLYVEVAECTGTASGFGGNAQVTISALPR